MLSDLFPNLPDIFKVALPFAVGIPLFFPLYWWGSKKQITFNLYDFLLYTGATYMGFVLLEASFGLIHEMIFGNRLWEYRMLPNHHDYGSYLGMLMWPLYGVHVYWFKQVMDVRAKKFYASPYTKGLFTAVEGPLFELVGNGIILLAFGQYLFYYFPPELNHLTTFWVMPHYGAAGVIFGFFINAVTKAPRTWGLPLSLYAMGFCVTALG